MITIQLDACLLQIRQILEREFNWLLANGTDREVLDEVRYYLFYNLELNDFSHCIQSCSGHVQNNLKIEGNLKTIVN